MSKIPTTISMSMGEPWTSPHDYPPGHIQGGEKGIVFSKKGNYRTAFVEYFPDENPTMIRGEGSTIEEADADLWKKFLNQKACPTHEYEPRGYTNGAGFCKHCNRFSSKQFTAEELGQFCRECGIPTGVKEGYYYAETKDFACEEHKKPEPFYDMMVYILHEYDGPEEEEDPAFPIFYQKLRRIVWHGAEEDSAVLEYFQKIRDTQE